MSEDEDEDHVYYGSALEPLDEENLPKKKPVLIQDQIATDKYGKRRFHGAFTGGFSAGFFNTVGTLEGWKPSQFKSSRNSKADTFTQKPEDFMDDEDTDDFGIAPIQMRAKPEYSGSSASKRKFITSDGPIPGDPVLKQILEPPSITVGMRLLMKLGWKPGQGIGPLLTWTEKMGDEYNPKEMGLNPDMLFPPTPVQEHFINAKIDKFGLGYIGLSKEPVLQQRFTLFDDPLKVDENKKKMSIHGQAFGVGAFEEEDEDIYAKDDMSRYDFALETSANLREAKRRELMKEKEKLAICESYNCIKGFLPAKTKSDKKKYFPLPDLPKDFDPNKEQKRSRFDSEIKCNPDRIKGKHILNSADRTAILGDRSVVTTEINENTEVNLEVIQPNQIQDTGFRPFVSDNRKQERYERYLGFIRIGAKDALKNIQPAEMSEWEKEREANEFEQAAKLYRPLSGMMGDKFSSGGLLDDAGKLLDRGTKSDSDESADEPWVKAAKEKKFGKLTRFISDWYPVPILCKRMNIPEPRDGGSALAIVAEEANKRKPKFSAFDFLDSSKNCAHVKPENHFSEEPSTSNINILQEYTETENVNKETILLPKPLLDPKIVDAEEKMDLFKAIFASDEESDSELQNDAKITKVLEMDKNENKMPIVNALRNMSPPRGIFANLDLDALKPKALPPKKNNETETISDKLARPMDASNTGTEIIDPSLLFGPSLPAKPLFIPKTKFTKESESSSSEDEWIEKDQKESKKKKHSKKYRKEKKRDRHKHKKKKRH